MQVLRPFRYTIALCGLFMLCGAFFVAIRLAPLSMRGGVAWGTLWPLVAAALTTLFEAALIFGTPTGFVLASGAPAIATSTESAGGSMSAISHRSLRVAIVCWCIAAAAAGSYANVRLGAPGRVAHGVVQGARAVCEDGEQHRIEPVPLIGARWICAPSAIPRIVGEVTRNGATARYSARDLAVSEDLDHVDLKELDVTSPKTATRPAIHIAVNEARLHGAWPWAKARRFSGWWRAVLVASLASFLALGAVRLAQRHATWSRVKGSLVAVIGSFAAWYGLALVDAHEGWPIIAYLSIPLVTLVPMAIASLLLSIQERAFWRRRARTSTRARAARP